MAVTPVLRSRWCVLSAAALAIWGCAEGGGERSAGGPSGGGGSGTGGASFAGSPSGGVGADAGSFLPGDGSTFPVEACATSVERAQPTPVDLYVLLDTSASMLELVAGNLTKFEAVGTAIARFAQDPQSAGLGLGLQFFPKLAPGVPAECTTHLECGTNGPCTLNACTGTMEVVWCMADADCPTADGLCLPVGVCQGNPSLVCSLGLPCGQGLGRCVDFVRTCATGHCESSTYATPEVEITELNAGATAIIDAMNSATFERLTPTAPALQGAVDHARDWAMSHPDHVVVAVLASDGVATECSPTDIAGIAGIAAGGLSGTPSIRTYVIGVIGATADPTNNSPENLAELATAGGTDQPFIVDASGDVTEQFAAALNDIRGAALSCEFQIPPPPEGETLDFGKVNLDFTSEGASRELVYVQDVANCAAAEDGWYYDVDPSTGATPAKVVVCPRVCDDFKTAWDGSVRVTLGCETRIFIQ